jgi:asparagine synthase (glutamine-hydrolysing)
MDQPSIDGVNTWFVAKAAKEAGLKVAISGLGGDELFAGYPSFLDVPRWRRRYGPFSRIPGLGHLARIFMQTFLPEVARRQPKALSLLEYAHSWAGAYLLRRGLFLPYELGQILPTDIVQSGLRRLALLNRLEATLLPDPGSPIGRICALESANYLRNQLLRDADWAGMAHGLEIRVPLVDFTLLNRVSAVMPLMKRGMGKAALASAPRDPLPNEIAVRPKTGFAIPVGAWLAADNPATPVATASSQRTKGHGSRRWSRVVFEHSEKCVNASPRMAH